MKIVGKLSRYRSKTLCKLDMFRLPAIGHDKKTWTTKDDRKLLIRDMDTVHLWNTYRMLLKVINEVRSPEQEYIEEERIDIARNALQYIGHELYKREIGVPKLPSKNIRKKINRADNLKHGFVDNKEIGVDWDNGEFYKD